MAENYVNNLPVRSILMGMSAGIIAGAVTATTTAAKIPATPLAKRKSIMVRNDSGVVAYLGNSTVTTAGLNGFKFNNGEVISVDLDSSIDLYVVLASGTGNIFYLEGS